MSDELPPKYRFWGACLVMLALAAICAIAFLLLYHGKVIPGPW